MRERAAARLQVELEHVRLGCLVDRHIGALEERGLRLDDLVVDPAVVSVDDRRRPLQLLPVLLAAEPEQLFHPLVDRLVRRIAQRVVEDLKIGEVLEEADRGRERLERIVADEQLGEAEGGGRRRGGAVASS